MFLLKDTVCRIISIDNMIFKDNYESEFLDTIVFIDRSNLYLRFDKMEKKFTKNFLSKIEKYGLNLMIFLKILIISS